MGEKPDHRLERIVSALLRGRRLQLRGGDAEEKEAIIMAARLAAARQGPQRMTPAFRQRLARELEQTQWEGWLTRRGALVAGVGALAGAIGGGILSRAIETSAPTRVAGGSVISPTHGTWVDVGALADFQSGSARMVKAGAVSAFVYRRGDALNAVSSVCSDLPCELWWDPDHAVLACPCHNKSFLPDGRSTDTQYPLPALAVVNVRVTAGDRVEVLGV
jgi:nitrite reductase/ring-hydroxylating ferredoxin subunit